MNPFLMIQADMAETQVAVDSLAAASTPVERISLWQMALNGGWIMLVLALLLALAIYIAVERYLALRQAVKVEDDDLFMNNIREYIHKGDVDGTRALSKQTNSPLARMVDKRRQTRSGTPRKARFSRRHSSLLGSHDWFPWHRYRYGNLFPRHGIRWQQY